MNKSNIATILLLASFVGCQFPYKRDPSSLVSSTSWDELRELKQRKIELSAESVHLQKKKKASELKKIKNDLAMINSRISELEARTSILDTNKVHVIKSDLKNWRNEKEQIELNDLSLYSFEKNVEFSVSTFEAIETEVRLTQNLFSTRHIDYKHYDKKSEMEFTIKCDAPFSLKYGLGYKSIKADETVSFNLADKKYSNDFRDLILTPDFKSCAVSFKDAQQSNGKTYQFKLVNEEARLKKLAPLLSTTEIC